MHEIWAFKRINEGWSYGERRDDKLKTTPGFVPYEELPDSEKQYDRNTGFGTIKLILALGYHVEKEEQRYSGHIAEE